MALGIRLGFGYTLVIVTIVQLFDSASRKLQELAVLLVPISTSITANPRKLEHGFRRIVAGIPYTLL